MTALSTPFNQWFPPELCLISPCYSSKCAFIDLLWRWPRQHMVDSWATEFRPNPKCRSFPTSLYNQISAWLLGFLNTKLIHVKNRREICTQLIGSEPFTISCKTKKNYHKKIYSSLLLHIILLIEQSFSLSTFVSVCWQSPIKTSRSCWSPPAQVTCQRSCSSIKQGGRRMRRRALCLGTLLACCTSPKRDVSIGERGEKRRILMKSLAGLNVHSG